MISHMANSRLRALGEYGDFQREQSKSPWPGEASKPNHNKNPLLRTNI